jgi:hypothetical protein
MEVKVVPGGKRLWPGEVGSTQRTIDKFLVGWVASLQSAGMVCKKGGDQTADGLAGDPLRGSGAAGYSSDLEQCLQQWRTAAWS